jgi:phospholipid/cholesterol/gamma-HCH transport system permease protein
MTDVVMTPRGEGGEPGSTRAERVARRLADMPQVRGPFEALGEVITFGAKAVREIPVALRYYPEEVVRQAALTLQSNAMVCFFMLFMMGCMLGLAGVFVFGSVGLASFVGAIFGGPGQRGPFEMVFAWVFAAKAGCGIVSELGAMRISEEIDAVEVMGIRPIPYLVSTRIIAAAVVLPVIYTFGLIFFFFGGELFAVKILGALSAGGFWNVNYLMQSPKDYFLTALWSTLLGVMVAIISSYFGYHAKGGPVGVGRGTAQSMMVNLVMISLVSVAISELLYFGVDHIAIGT